MLSFAKAATVLCLIIHTCTLVATICFSYCTPIMIGRALSRSVATLAKRDSVLFTPGPLTTSLEVKQAMLRDYGSRDPLFLEVSVPEHCSTTPGIGVQEAQAFKPQDRDTAAMACGPALVIPVFDLLRRLCLIYGLGCCASQRLTKPFKWSSNPALAPSVWRVSSDQR